jgi:hypothetical protein
VYNYLNPNSKYRQEMDDDRVDAIMSFLWESYTYRIMRDAVRYQDVEAYITYVIVMLFQEVTRGAMG